MHRLFHAIVLFAIVSPAAAWGNPLAVVDLASATDWTYKRDTEADWKPIEIPNQLSVKTTADRWIDYRRNFTVPEIASDQDTTLRFLSVNDGGEIYINDQQVGVINYGLFPADIDIRQFIQPGKSAQLTVRCFSRNHYYHGGAFPQDHNGEELLGIPRGVSAIVSPAVHIVDCFVISSVTKKTIGAEVTVSNQSSETRTVDIASTLTKWRPEDRWHYPSIPDKRITLPPHSETKVAIEPVAWTLGPDSYWWPNIPFREDYQAALHLLNLEMREGARLLDSQTRRFGFVEAGEGPNYYTINGVRVFEFQDGTQEHLWSPGGKDGFQISYEQLPGWQAGPGGAVETWKRYLRLGFNCFRLHSSAGSESMLDAADEVGFMIVGESGIRGYAKPEEEWDPVYKPAAVAAMVKTYRSHPSIVRYSLDNEWAEATRNDEISRGLIDAAVSEDTTRPLSFSQDKVPWVKECFGSDKVHHAWVLDHYHKPTTAPNVIAGIEEDYWKREGSDKNELIECSRAAIMDRLGGLAVFSPWNLNNYWCNFVLGGSKKSGTVNPKWRNKDRSDGIDGWGSDLIRFMQNCYSIFASADVDLIANHLNNESQIFDPARAATLISQSQIKRQLVAFNNSLASHSLSIHWELHWDRPAGQLVASGDTETKMLAPGEHDTPSIVLQCPAATSTSRLLYFPIKTIVDGVAQFSEDRYVFNVVDADQTATSGPATRSK